jgi:8-oxo-dGTP diphosphatase
VLHLGYDMSDRGPGASGDRALTDYPRPSVAVDTAVLTYRPAVGLLVLQVRRDPGPGWALPGTFLRERETLDHAVRRSLREKADVRGVGPRQLHVFDRPGRDDRGWVLSVGHVAVVPVELLAGRFPDTTRLMPAAAPGRLAFDHQDIIGLALEDLRSRYRDRPDPDRLLGEVFTLRQLRQVHEAVAGAPITADKLDTFRRRMQQKLVRVPAGPVRTDGRGRPAQLFGRHEAQA